MAASRARRRILIVAYHFPPSHGSSGIQRTLKFATYLREHDWEPLVLTISPRAYEQVSDGQMDDIPEGVVIRRAFGLDTSRHLAVRGRYLHAMAQPDRWVSWWPAGVMAGLRMIRRERPSVIMSTFPIATAHLIARTLHRRSGLPWVADFRDAMTEPDYPRDPRTWAVQRRLEHDVVSRCTLALFTAPGTLEMYRTRYPEVPQGRWAVVENGFDEENFADAESGLNRSPLGVNGQVVLVHSGILYPEERDPRPLFEAVARLKSIGEVDASKLQVRFRGTGKDAHYKAMVRQNGIEDIVDIQPGIAYRDALQEMLRADGLLLMQAAICNHQIPAKLYEYARAGRPILGLVDPKGDSAELLGKLGVRHMADIANADQIVPILSQFVTQVRSDTLRGVEPRIATTHSRRSRTAELARLLNQQVCR